MPLMTFNDHYDQPDSVQTAESSTGWFASISLTRSDSVDLSFSMPLDFFQTKKKKKLISYLTKTNFLATSGINLI